MQVCGHNVHIDKYTLSFVLPTVLPTVRNNGFVFLPPLPPLSPQPFLLRLNRASVLLSSTPSSSLPPLKHFRFSPPGLKEAHYLTVLSQCVQCTHSAKADRSRAVQKHPTYSVSVAPSCAITNSIFPHKRHAGPFKNRSTQHPPLHAGTT